MTNTYPHSKQLTYNFPTLVLPTMKGGGIPVPTHIPGPFICKNGAYTLYILGISCNGRLVIILTTPRHYVQTIDGIYLLSITTK